MNNHKYPNFLIVGMAKCGTTSLSQYLSQHPQIFISEKKEPRFITSQTTKLPLGGPKDHLVESWYVKNENDYLQLFKGATEKAIGEASADTLYYHQSTIPFIKEFLGDPKILIILRNPVKRSFSAYKHLVRDGRESLSFEEGLREEPVRIQKNYELIYHYKNASLYYEPVKAFLNSFSSVKIILNEDLNIKPNETMSEVYQFLEVSGNFKPNSSHKYNVSGKPKNKLLHESLSSDTAFRKLIRPVVRTILPNKESRINIVNWLKIKNLSDLKIKSETAIELSEFYESDVKKIEDLIKKDLSGWIIK